MHGGGQKGVTGRSLDRHQSGPHVTSMFTITDDEAAKVRAAFERSGALAAAAEMGRLFPGLSVDDAQVAARMIVRWYPSAHDDEEAGRGGG